MAPPSVRCLGAVRECAANPRFACADPLFAQAELIVPGKSVAPKASGTERASGGTVTFRDAAFTLYVRLKRCCCVPTIHSPQPLPTSTATSRRRHLVASTSVGEASRGKLWSACVHAASARSARLMPTSLPRCGSLRDLRVCGLPGIPHTRWMTVAACSCGCAVVTGRPSPPRRTHRRLVEGGVAAHAR